MKSVLFVCTANRCRSPMAEALLKAKVAKLGRASEWQITSAGTWAEPDLPPLPLTLTVLANRGLDVSTHRSQMIDAGLLGSHALILVMTKSHREGLTVEFPNVAPKIMLLSQLAGPAYDIDDPARGMESEYDACATELAQILDRGFERLVQLAESKTPSAN